MPELSGGHIAFESSYTMGTMMTMMQCSETRGFFNGQTITVKQCEKSEGMMIHSNSICIFWLWEQRSMKNHMPSGLQLKNCFFFYYDQYCNDLNSIMASPNMLHHIVFLLVHFSFYEVQSNLNQKEL